MFRKYTRTILIISILAVVLGTKAYYDTNTIEIKKYQIRHSSLGDVLGGLKVVQLSDLHIKQVKDREKKIIEILDQEKPDLIFLTGDYIKANGPYQPAQLFFSQLKAPLGIYAVMGNTEYYNENGSCVLCHQSGSKRLKEKPHPVFLRNSHVNLKRSGKVLTVLGVDDPVNKKSDLKQSLKNALADGPSILLAHSPEIFLEASALGVDLVLSGHTHGGQLGLIKYLKKIFPLEAALEFLDGFFQKGKTLMYVNRGVGTSFFPFRFGVKPEIAFFNFVNPSGQSGSNGFQITDTSSKMIFAGFDLSNIFEPFNIFDVIKNRLFDSKVREKSNLLFDFESQADLEKLNWECHKWFELSIDHKTSGKYSLKVSLPPGQYPGISFKEIPSDWSRYAYLKMDIFNPSRDSVPFHIRIDDYKSNWEYANRFDRDVELKPGLNPISIPTHSINTNLRHRILNLHKIERLIVFVPNNQKSRELYIDNIRLN
jgi:uncharacterized protein